MNRNNIHKHSHGEWRVVEERSWTQSESDLFNNPLLDNAACYAPHPTSKTDLTLAKVYRNDALIGVAPVVRLIQYPATRLLQQKYRKWLNPLFSFVTRETTCMIDSSFLAYRYADPFFSLAAADAKVVREAVVKHLQGCPGVDNIVITEPVGDPGWARAKGFLTFLQLPLVRVELDGCAKLDDYLMKLSKKRRKNFRNDRKLFKEGGGTMSLIPPPQSRELLGDLHATLLASAAQNRSFEIPFGDLLNSRPAFDAQQQWVIIARDGDNIAGFFAFIPHDDTLCQCHGGLDYRYSPRLKVYQNLLHEAVVHAIDKGFRQVTFGPLNNEAKRRCGTLAATMSAFWLRKRLSRWMMQSFMLRRFQAYQGEWSSPIDTPKRIPE